VVNGVNGRSVNGTESYDYVIVGAGSAGCVLATRLKPVQAIGVEDSATILVAAGHGLKSKPAVSRGDKFKLRGPLEGLFLKRLGEGEHDRYGLGVPAVVSRKRLAQPDRLRRQYDRLSAAIIVREALQTAEIGQGLR